VPAFSKPAAGPISIYRSKSKFGKNMPPLATDPVSVHF
jgi:hypothetical protein